MSIFRTIVMFIYLFGYMIVHYGVLRRAERALAAGDMQLVEELVNKHIPHWSRGILKVTGVSLSVEGLENIPKDTACVFVGNHRSYYDIPLLLASLDKPHGILAKEELEKIVDKFEKQGLDVTLITGKDYNVFGLVGDTTKIDERDVLANPWIDNVTRVSAPYKRANRLFHPADSVIDCGGVKIGGKEKIAVMAGPCSIEGAEQALRIAQGVKAGGATLFRGGAYKPRTSPYSFQGLETEGILDMVKAREATGMPIVSELMSEDRIPEFEEYVDVVQIGARNMQNFQLLKAVGKMHKPVLLKRGLCNTIEEWIMSAEYIMAGGNEQVILCERGIRTFEKYTRNTLDLSAVPIIHEKTHLPIIVDPSHATGKANLVEPMMIAAVAAGADGLEVEVHYDPQHAWSDGAQCLTPDSFAQAMAKCRQVAWAIGRDM